MQAQAAVRLPTAHVAENAQPAVRLPTANVAVNAQAPAGIANIQLAPNAQLQPPLAPALNVVHQPLAPNLPAAPAVNVIHAQHPQRNHTPTDVHGNSPLIPTPAPVPALAQDGTLLGEGGWAQVFIRAPGTVAPYAQKVFDTYRLFTNERDVYNHIQRNQPPSPYLVQMLV